jgi:hypothetical protein
MMRTSGVVALAFLTAGLCAAADYSGDWIAQVTGSAEPQWAHVGLQTSGSRVSGNWGENKLEGIVTGDKVEFSLTGIDGRPAGSLTGTGRGLELSGEGNIAMPRRGGGGGGGSETQAVTWKLTRVPQPAQTRKTWDFEPTVF